MIENKMEVDSMMSGAKFLEHYGTKGMKWGVRRAEKRMAKADKKWQKNIYSMRGAIDVHNASAGYFNTRIDAVNLRHPKANLLDSPNTRESKAYLREVEQLTRESVENGVSRVHGTSPSGRLTARLDFSDKDQPRIVVVGDWASHADEPDAKLLFEVTLNDAGLIEQLHSVRDNLEQSDASESEEFLEHYGIKGMQWGVRKRRSSAAKGKTTYQKKPARLSDAELNRRIKRLELERKYSELNSAQKSPGKKYAKGILENQGKTAAGAVVGGVVTFFVQRELKKRFG